MLRQISNLIGSKILCQNKPTTATRAAVAQWTRPLSSQQTPSTTTNATTSKSVAPGTTIVDTEDGRTFAALFDTRKQPKLKPSIVRKRLEKMRTYAGAEKNIRHSPWRINLICQMVAGLPLQEALRQLEFCEKSKAPLVQKVLRRTAKLADVRDGLQRECFCIVCVVCFVSFASFSEMINKVYSLTLIHCCCFPFPSVFSLTIGSGRVLFDQGNTSETNKTHGQRKVWKNDKRAFAYASRTARN